MICYSLDGTINFTKKVAKVSTGINAENSGMMLELERQIDNAIGVDVIYNPDCEDGETPFMVSTFATAKPSIMLSLTSA